MRGPAFVAGAIAEHNAMTCQIPELLEDEAAVETLLSAVITIEPLIKTHASDLRHGPDLPDSIANALGTSGLTSLWVPKSLGGPELSPVGLIRVVEALARLDGSVGWCVGVAATGSRIAGLVPRHVSRSLFSAHGFTAGSLTPAGTAVRENGGWRVSGRWPWGSFVRHARAVVAACREQHEGAGSADHDAPVLRLAIVPASDVTILDNWCSAGLRATGSHDYTIDQVFVPDDWTISLSRYSAAPHESGALYGLPFVTVLGLGIAAVPLGLGRAAIDSLCELAKGKTVTGTPRLLKDETYVQSDIARAEAMLRSARAFLLDSVGQMWRTAVQKGRNTFHDRASVRMACWHAAKTGREVVEMMHLLAGGTAVRDDSPFAAQLRDVQAVTQHIYFAEQNMQTAGRVLLGMDAGTDRF
jgi:indole-3-acetate monooxygenase